MIEIDFLTKFNRPVVLAMGFFDCVHTGHRALLTKCAALARAAGAAAAATTFCNNAYKRFNPDSKLIYTYAERLCLFAEAGMDACVPFKFDAAFKQTDKREFLDLLLRNLDIKAAVCGYDYLFGSRGGGDAQFLREYFSARGVAVHIERPVTYNGERVSSTLVKETLSAGNIEKANILLARPYFMQGSVERGRGVGASISAPTANLKYSKDKLLAKAGVYSTRTTLDGNTYKSVTSIGPKPTFDEPSITVETFIDGVSSALYGKTLRVEFFKYLRPLRKFPSPSALSLQIKADLEA
ncbi:MAG: riboflavin biosynthesis protein RibF [Clostridiales bacterium]|jgi:riboflavin kinase/FMN adenylyltransferase|nr:riboflavin biosynthesis protein RibF [Clostridiales bacterium]